MAAEMVTSSYSVGVIGARGHVGRELIRLLHDSEHYRVTAAVSRELAGHPVGDATGCRDGDLRFTPTLDEHLDACPDIIVLGLPDGHARGAVDAIEASGATPRLILDLSSDHRFDDGWVYSVPELHAGRLRGASRISNPGCYATAMHLALAPVIRGMRSAPHCFGLSGYTGAGSSPSEKNNVQELRRGVLPYSLVEHTHEREVSHHIGAGVRFTPAVAGYPRGITLVAQLEFEAPTTPDELERVYNDWYSEAQLVHVSGRTTPRVQDVVMLPVAIIGGVSVDEADPTRAAVVCVLDNLLKGAASQAMQNINIALGHLAEAGLVL
ncbi:MAG: Asd/ArgC dimerization domain-containing protein [Phycisphaerales bacterium JB043]